MYDVAIIGGGLAGLVNAIVLRKAGFSVILFEEKKYPFHRVCGEYISNEVIPFLKSHDLYPQELNPIAISKFKLTSTSGKPLEMDLDLGGFGISRFSFDHWLAGKSVKVGVELREGERVTSVQFEDNHHRTTTGKGEYASRIVIGSFGKRSKLDKDLNRASSNKKSPYIGVKYPIKTTRLDSNIIELHNFQNGYCGVSKVENETFNLCYLSHRDNLKSHKEIKAMEEHVLHQNPNLKELFMQSDFLFDRPEVINEISFEKKEPIFNHILMSGDAAGMITPLCGNGMAMAIHSAKILSECVIDFLTDNIDRGTLEGNYAKYWNSLFARRLWAGRKIQKLFGSAASSEFAVELGLILPPISKYLMNQTHGSPF
jgi:flavin-dependent dehydrogenase